MFQLFTNYGLGKITKIISRRALSLLLTFSALMFVANPAMAVIMVIEPPDVSASGLNNHTNSGRMSYVISYIEENNIIPLQLYDDPRFFELRRADDDSMVISDIFIRFIDSTSREIRIENIQGEGDFYLYVYAGTAEDGEGFVGAGSGAPFTVDKTEPLANLTGPFEADLVTPVNIIEAGDTVYYVLDFSVDHMVEPFKSRYEADIFAIEPVGDGNWRIMSDDYFALTNGDFSGVARASRTGAQIVIRIQNISGPEEDFGIYILEGAASDFAMNSSPRYESDLVPFDDDIGPDISIGAPNPALTHGDSVVYGIDYTNSTTVTLNNNDIIVHTTGDVTADLTVMVVSQFFAQVIFTNFVGEGEISFSIAAGSAADASGDLAPAAGPSAWATVDIYGPQVVFGEPSPLHTVSGPAIFPVTFVSAISVSLVQTDVIVNTTGNVQYDRVEVNPTGVDDSREVHVIGLSGEGTVSINIPANVAIDPYLQGSVASEESPAVQVGPLPPMSISIGAPNPGYTVAGPVSYVVTYAGVAAIGLDLVHLSVQASGTAYANDIAITGSGLSRTVTLSDIGGEGILALIIAAGSAQDAEANFVGGIAGNAFAVGNNDDDGDLVPNGQEELDGTDRDDPASYLDSDGDLVPDFVEQYLDATDKFDAFSYKDSDDGGTPDYVESVRLPLTVAFAFNVLDESDDQHDSDGDGLPDYLELKLRVAGSGYHENDKDLPVVDGDLDSDSDGIADGLEFYLSELLGIADPGFYDDFDRDGYFDHHEVRFGLDPELAAVRNDADSDGIPDRVEAAAGIDISPSSDMDGDGIPDFIEYVFNRARVNLFDSASVYISSLIQGSPLIDADTDTDEDGMPDLDELAAGFNPLRGDAPVLWLSLRQGQPKASVCHVSLTAGEVEVRVMIGNMQTHISQVDWSLSNADILGIANQYFDRLSFDPATLTAGLYDLVVRVERNQGNETLESTLTQHIRIAAGVIRADLDEDGICDDRETVVSSVAQRNQAPLNAAGELLRSQPGHFFHLGYLSHFVNNASNLQIPYAVVESRGNDLTATTVEDIVDSQFGNLIPRVHFELRNLPSVGASAQLILPLVSLTDGLPASAQYRVLANTGWQNFDTTEDVLESAPQNCHNSPVFESGLKQGYRCIRMTMRDGGANDLDGVLNGLILHLGAPALQGAAHVDNPDEGEEENPDTDFVAGKRTIVVGEAGSLNVLVMALLWMMLMFRLSVQHLPRFIFFSGLLFSLSLHADETSDKNWLARTWDKLPLPGLEHFYAGVGLGQSGLDGDFSNLYDVKDDSDFGFKLWLDYQFRERWFAEFEYANLGESSVQASAAALAANVFPAQFTETIAYQHTSITALYDYPLPYEKFSVFAKAGIAYADIQSDWDIEVADRFSPSIGLGTQYRFNKKYIARLEYETFSKDSNLLSLAIAMRLAEPKQQEQAEALAQPEPVAAAVSEEEQLAQAQEEQVPQTLEEFMKALEPEEPSMSMEELYADLKASIEPSSLFEQDSAALSRRLMANLDELVHFLDTYPNVRVVITGHASDEGGEFYNENLSRLRAHGAKIYLQANGISEERVIVRARGMHFPKFTEMDDDYRIRNRRVEYDFYIPKKK